jgi:DNA-binding MarR family transcriptional regulator
MTTRAPWNLRHHSTVELVDRAEKAGLVERWADDDDGRLTRVRLTAEGEACLSRLAPAHLDELRNLAPVLDQLVARWTGPAGDHDFSPRGQATSSVPAAMPDA